jgi:TPR repeat protein
MFKVSLVSFLGTLVLVAGATLSFAQRNPMEPQSIRELRAKAESGDAAAQYRLANAYRLGQDLLRDSSLAVEWYRKAAEQDYRDAQYNLAMSYRKGIGVAKNTVEAVRWYKAAA